MKKSLRWRAVRWFFQVGQTQTRLRVSIPIRYIDSRLVTELKAFLKAPSLSPIRDYYAWRQSVNDAGYQL